MIFYVMKILLGSGGHTPTDRKRALVHEIQSFLGSTIERFLFIPYALQDWDYYAECFKELGLAAGYHLDSIHKAPDPKQAIASAEAIYIGGGNTNRLLSRLYEFDLVETVRERVRAGIPYIGLSAGSNVACPTTQTSNDMVIMVPPTFKALSLVPFQINPHYHDHPENPGLRAETRALRIQEYLEENPNETVVGMREGSVLRINDDNLTLGGNNGIRVFYGPEIGKQPEDFWPEDAISFLLK